MLRAAIVAGAVAAILVAAYFQAWQRRPSVVHEVDWGRTTGDGVLNAVRRVETFDAERG